MGCPLRTLPEDTTLHRNDKPTRLPRRRWLSPPFIGARHRRSRFSSFGPEDFNRLLLAAAGIDAEQFADPMSNGLVNFAAGNRLLSRMFERNLDLALEPEG